MKVVVTGGAGFLGQGLCRGLLALGHEVTSFQRGHSPALAALGVRQVLGDLADAGAVLDAFQGQEAVFHNAARQSSLSRVRKTLYASSEFGECDLSFSPSLPYFSARSVRSGAKARIMVLRFPYWSS